MDARGLIAGTSTVVVIGLVVAVVALGSPALSPHARDGAPAAAASPTAAAGGSSLPTDSAAPLRTAPPAWTATDIPLPEGTVVVPGDAGLTALTPSTAIAAVRNLGGAFLLGEQPVARFLFVGSSATDAIAMWVVASDDLPRQPSWGPAGQSSRQPFVATYGWAFLNPSGTELLSKVLVSYTADTLPASMPPN